VGIKYTEEVKKNTWGGNAGEGEKKTKNGKKAIRG